MLRLIKAVEFCFSQMPILHHMPQVLPPCFAQTLETYSRQYLDEDSEATAKDIPAFLRGVQSKNKCYAPFLEGCLISLQKDAQARDDLVDDAPQIRESAILILQVFASLPVAWICAGQRQRRLGFDRNKFSSVEVCDLVTNFAGTF